MGKKSWRHRLADFLQQTIVPWLAAADTAEETSEQTADEALPRTDSEFRTWERQQLPACRPTSIGPPAGHEELPRDEVPTVPEPKGELLGDDTGKLGGISAVRAAQSQDVQWLKLVEECVALIAEFEDNVDRYHPEARPWAEHAAIRLRGTLETCGVDSIRDEASFDIARHQAIPPARIPQGTPIAKTLVPGFCIGSHVLLRAKVTTG